MGAPIGVLEMHFQLEIAAPVGRPFAPPLCSATELRSDILFIHAFIPFFIYSLPVVFIGSFINRTFVLSFINFCYDRL